MSGVGRSKLPGRASIDGLVSPSAISGTGSGGQSSLERELAAAVQ